MTKTDINKLNNLFIYCCEKIIEYSYHNIKYRSFIN